MSVTVSSDGEADTRATGRRLASMLRPDDVILLSGDLGAGKTTLVSGIAEGLGIEEAVTSPSFILARRYSGGFIPLVHADVYRLSSMAEFDDLGVFEEATGAVLVVEWGPAVSQSVPPDHLVIVIEALDEGARLLTFEPRGSWAGRPLNELT